VTHDATEAGQVHWIYSKRYCSVVFVRQYQNHHYYSICAANPQPSRSLVTPRHVGWSEMRMLMILVIETLAIPTLPETELRFQFVPCT
jgi:hypothetical protein